MALEKVHCAVLNGPVARVTDLEGNVTRVICPELLNGSRLCRRRVRASEGGPLSQLLLQLSEHDLQMKGYSCLMQS
jgi:hypothetical protein